MINIPADMRIAVDWLSSSEIKSKGMSHSTHIQKALSLLHKKVFKIELEKVLIIK